VRQTSKIQRQVYEWCGSKIYMDLMVLTKLLGDNRGDVPYGRLAGIRIVIDDTENGNIYACGHFSDCFCCKFGNFY